MRTTLKLLTALGFAVAGLGFLVKHCYGSSTRKMLNKVADEGYETAIDILFPEEVTKARKLHYGPVIPA